MDKTLENKAESQLGRGVGERPHQRLLYLQSIYVLGGICVKNREEAAYSEGRSANLRMLAEKRNIIEPFMFYMIL